MTSKKISELTAGSVLGGSELVMIVQGGVTKRTTIADIMVGSSTVGGELLAGETDAMGIDFTYHTDRTKQLYISDLTTPANNYNGDPQGKLTYTSPSIKLCRQADGVWRYQSHNIYLNSAAPANQTMTVVSGGTYAIVVTGSVSITWSSAFVGTTTVGTTTITAASTSLTGGSTSGTGTVAVYRTPSVGNYLATAGAAVYDLPYHWDAALASQGILTEEQRTNLALRSREFDNASWVKGDGAITANSTVAPDGTTTADTFTSNSGSHTPPYVAQAYTRTASVTTTVSVFAKMGTHRYVAIGLDDTVANGTKAIFDLQTGAATGFNTSLGSGFTVFSSSVVDAGSGSYRLIASIATPAGTLGTMSVELRANGTTTGWSPTTSWAGTETAIFWGYQLEQNVAFVTSPIHTIGATVTRAADQIKILTSAFPHSDATLTVIANALIPYIPSANPNAKEVIELSDGTDAERHIMYIDSAGEASFISTDNNVTQWSDTSGAGTPSANTAFKIGFAAQQNDFAGVFNGGTVQTDVVGNMPTVTAMYFGANYAGSSNINGYIRQVTYLKRRASNAELQTRTA